MRLPGGPCPGPKGHPDHRDRLVLVVERSAPRAMVTSAVRNLGYRAQTFPTAADVLGYLKLHPGEVQCLLADLGLPEMNGGELAERASDLCPGLIVVLMAARGEPGRCDLLPAYGISPACQARVPRSARREARRSDRSVR